MTDVRWGIGAVPTDTIRRLGDLMGIHKALRQMFTDPERGYAWIAKPNEAFGGKSGLERAPSDTAVRSYLDTEGGGW